jgi:single-stranded DNA-binding protein
MRMTELQASLIAIGAVIVVGVIAYNKWTEWRAKNSVEYAFSDMPDDVLMGGGNGHQSQHQSPPHRSHDDAAHEHRDDEHDHSAHDEYHQQHDLHEHGHVDHTNEDDHQHVGIHRITPQFYKILLFDSKPHETMKTRGKQS